MSSSAGNHAHISQDEHPSPSLQIMLDTVHALHTKHKGSDQEADLLALFSEKVPVFVERALRDIEAKRNNKSQIEDCVHDLYQASRTKYVYNASQNAFYEVCESPVNLKLISSDQILMVMRDNVDTKLAPHRMHILRAVRVKLQSHNVFDWQPPQLVLQRMIKEILRSFSTKENALYFMHIVGTIVNHKEDALLVDSNNKKPIVHLWYGQCMENVVECMQRILFNTIKSFSPFWNKIKRRMHHSYPFSQIRYLHFPPTTHNTPFRIIKHSPLMFLACCSYVYKQNPLFMQNTASVHKTAHIASAQELFSHYIHENVILTNKSNHNPHKQQFLLLREIVDDFNEFLIQQDLPPDVVTKQDVLQSIQMMIQHESYGTRGIKRLYYSTFKISTGETLHELFLRFCGDVLHQVSDDDAETTSHEISSTNTRVSSLQLHNNYRMWCKYYVSTQEGIDMDMHGDSNHQNRHWYCSYKLFQKLLEKRFPLMNNKHTLRVIPHAQLWKVYLEKYVNDNISDPMEVWALRDFGVHFEHVFTISDGLQTLVSEDVASMQQHISVCVDTSVL